MARKSVKKKRPAKPIVAPAAVPTEHGRFEYSAIIDRPRLSWPNGARVAVWVIPNVNISCSTGPQRDSPPFRSIPTC